MKRYFAIVTVVVVLFVAGGLALKSRRPRQASTPPEAAAAVMVVRPKMGDMAEIVEITGSIVPASEITVSANMGGRVIYRAGGEGDRVSAGQVLVRLQDTELRAQLSSAGAAVAAASARLSAMRAGARAQEREQADNGVRQARAAFDNARQNYERMKTLQAQGAIAQQQLDLAYTQYVAAESQYNSARAQMSLVGEGARPEDIRAAEATVSQARGTVDLLQAQLANTVLHAPVSGVISKCSIEKGEMAMPGYPLMTISEQSRLYLEARVSETDFVKLKLGQAASVTVDAVPGLTVNGKVTEIVPVADSKSRSFKIRISLAGNSIKAGMFGRAVITVNTRSDIVSLPTDVLRRKAAESYVMLVQDGKAVKTVVRTGIVSRGYVEVTGINPDAAVISVGQDEVVDGQAVAVHSVKEG